jgi:hypothetical protein
MHVIWKWWWSSLTFFNHKFYNYNLFQFVFEFGLTTNVIVVPKVVYSNELALTFILVFADLKNLYHF